MKYLTLIAVSALAIAGCNSSDSTMSKSEIDELKNPAKTMPKEAADAMANPTGGSSLSPKNPPAGVPANPPGGG